MNASEYVAKGMPVPMWCNHHDQLEVAAGGHESYLRWTQWPNQDSNSQTGNDNG